MDCTRHRIHHHYHTIPCLAFSVVAPIRSVHDRQRNVAPDHPL